MSDIPHLDGHKLVHLDPACLKPHPDNPRTHSKEQVRKIAASIKRFGSATRYWSMTRTGSSPVTADCWQRPNSSSRAFPSSSCRE